MVATTHVDLPIRNEWLADLLMEDRSLLTEYWLEDIRATDIPGYRDLSDERLRAELPATIDSMIYAFRTGDTAGPRKHALEVIQRRLADGLQLPDLQSSLHVLETAVMRVVKTAQLGSVKEYAALQSASNMYFMVALIAAAVYEELRAQQQRRFTAAYEFGVSLSSELDLGVILDMAVARVAEHTGGDSVAILLANSDGGDEELRAYYNLDSDLVEAMPEIRGALDCGTMDAYSLDMYQTSCAVSDVRAYGQLSKWSDLLASHGRMSMLCAPLVAKQGHLGSLIVLWNEARILSSVEMGFAFAMAGHIANAVQNAILYQEAKEKRELGVLLDASKLFTSTLETDDILRNIAKMVTVAIRADLAIVFTRDHLPDHSHTSYYLRNRRAAAKFGRILDAVVAEGEQNGFESLGHEFASGKAVLYRTCAELPGRMQSLAGIGASGIVVPLRRKEGLVGAFVVLTMVPDAFTQEDVLLATGLADLASVAIDNALSYEYERHIAETLQRSFLPASVPAVKGYEIAAYYRPAMAEAEIGGDFYDVFETSEGHISIIIGDVSGKGLKSAVPTAMGKYMIRAYAAENLPPSEVMARFNRAFIEMGPEGLFTTAFYGVLDPATNWFIHASAGHDPPLHFSASAGQVTQFKTGGVCLGVTEGVRYVDAGVELQPGDVLLLYTDGATDVKGDSDRLGVEGLEQLLSNSADRPAQDIVRSVSDGIWDYSNGRLGDDVALVVIKRLESDL